MSVDESTCPGPDGQPIPLLIFDNARGDGKLAVSLTRTDALFTTPRTPLDFEAWPIFLSAEDRRELGRRLLGDVPPPIEAWRIEQVRDFCQRQIDHDAGKAGSGLTDRAWACQGVLNVLNGMIDDGAPK